MSKIDWDSVPDATHFSPESEDFSACFYKQDSNGQWLGKLGAWDNWDYNVRVDEDCLSSMISKEEEK